MPEAFSCLQSARTSLCVSTAESRPLSSSSSSPSSPHTLLHERARGRCRGCPGPPRASLFSADAGGEPLGAFARGSESARAITSSLGWETAINTARPGGPRYVVTMFVSSGHSLQVIDLAHRRHATSARLTRYPGLERLSKRIGAFHLFPRNARSSSPRRARLF